MIKKHYKTNSEICINGCCISEQYKFSNSIIDLEYSGPRPHVLVSKLENASHLNSVQV